MEYCTTTWKDLTNISSNQRTQAPKNTYRGIPLFWFQNSQKQSMVVDIRIMSSFDQGPNDWESAFIRLLWLTHYSLHGGHTRVHFVKIHWVLHHDFCMYVTLQWKTSYFKKKLVWPDKCIKRNRCHINPGNKSQENNGFVECELWRG